MDFDHITLELGQFGGLRRFEIFLSDYSEVVKFHFQGLLVGNTLNKQC